MRALLLAPVLCLVACSGGENDRSAAVDINGAARSAQNDIDSYAADTAPSPAPGPASRPPVAAPSPTAENVVSEAPFTPDSAQGAADVVQTYYALLGAGKYRDAWALWDNDGQASGMSAPAFAASFAKYADYHANVGAPGRIDSGAGQRYVTVPAKVHGTLRQGGRPFALSGTVTLHRAADIDGATAAQKRWRISAVDLKPTDDAAANDTPAPAIPPTATARYACTGGFAFTARFDNRADTATLRRGAQVLATLDGQRPASGIWYKGGGWELRGKGRDATLTRPGGDAPLQCRAAG